MTFDEFLEFDEKSPVRNEYINGVVRAMNGPTHDHDRITIALLVAIQSHLRGRACEVRTGSISFRIQSDTDKIVYHPDVMVACNKETWGKNWLRDPKLVLEVLSPSTEHIDRREKAGKYHRVDSIEEYVLVEQDEHLVVVQRRADNWHPHEYIGPEAVVEFRSINLTVPLTQIYAGTLESA